MRIRVLLPEDLPDQSPDLVAEIVRKEEPSPLCVSYTMDRLTKLPRQNYAVDLS